MFPYSNRIGFTRLDGGKNEELFVLLAIIPVLALGTIKMNTFGASARVESNLLDPESPPKLTSVPTPFLPLVMKDFVVNFDTQFEDSAIGWMNISGDWTLEKCSYTSYGLRGV